MKFIRKFFSWTFLYKTFQFFESIYIYLKDYYYISDTLYSEEFKRVINKYIYVDLRKDWIGRLYGVINPNIGADGKYDFSNVIFEINDENTNNNDYVKNIIYGKMDLIDKQFHINKLYDYISIDFKHVGPSYADNYLLIFDIASRKYMSICFKKWLTQGLIYAIIAMAIIIIIF